MIGVFMVLATIDCLAYLDPGAGSMVLQVLLGGTAAGLVILKLTWRRLRNVLGLTRVTNPTATDPPQG